MLSAKDAVSFFQPGAAPQGPEFPANQALKARLNSGAWIELMPGVNRAFSAGDFEFHIPGPWGVAPVSKLMPRLWRWTNRSFERGAGLIASNRQDVLICKKSRATHQRDVGESLREIAQLPPLTWIVFFREQSEIVAQIEETFE